MKKRPTDFIRLVFTAYNVGLDFMVDREMRSASSVSKNIFRPNLSVRVTNADSCM